MCMSTSESWVSAETMTGILTFLFGMTGFLLLQLGIQRRSVQQRRAANKGGVKWWWGYWKWRELRIFHRYGFFCPSSSQWYCWLMKNQMARMAIRGQVNMEMLVRSHRQEANWKTGYTHVSYCWRGQVTTVWGKVTKVYKWKVSATFYRLTWLCFGS